MIGSGDDSRLSRSLLDYSGYGEANRHFVAALKAAGVDVHGELVAYSKERADYGTLYRSLPKR